MAIRSVTSQSSWHWDWIHVKGHQDDTKPMTELDQWSMWNIEMDAEAKRLWQVAKHQYIDPPIQGEPWRIELNGKKVSSNLRDKLRESCCMPQALAHWDRKGRFGPFASTDIDWEVLGTAMKQSKPNRQRWVSKTISGFCATGLMMKRRKERDTDECPRCGATENVLHIWRCTHDTKDLWESSMKNLKEWLLASNTHPEMVRSIVDGLNSWRLGNSTGSTHIPWLQAIIDKQNKCGWQNFFEGLLLKDWRTEMNRHLSKLKTGKSSRRWAVALIRKMWQVAWDLWEHRNGYLHDNENNLISLQVNAEIQNEFTLGYRELDPPSRTLFAGGLNAVLHKPLEIRQQWLRRVQVARSRAIERHGYAAERKAMAQWLGTTRGSV
jgi:hypothetical protein